MAIQTRVEPRVKWWAVAYLVVCAAIGVWGLYDYAVRLPHNQADFERFQALSQEFAEFGQLDDQGALTDAQRVRWSEVDRELVEFAGAVPTEPAKWDRPVKLWLYVILTGVVGVVWFGTSLVFLLRRTYRLEDDGTLVMPEGRWTTDDIAGIDMDRWMEKSIATVIHTDGTRIKLDAYKYRDLHLIIGEIAHRDEPQRWQRDGRMVKSADANSAEPEAAGKAPGEAVRDDDDADADADGEMTASPAAEGAGPSDPTRT